MSYRCAQILFKDIYNTGINLKLGQHEVLFQGMYRYTYTLFEVLR